MTIEKDKEYCYHGQLHINRNVLKLLPLQNELGGCELQLESLSTVVLFHLHAIDHQKSVCRTCPLECLHAVSKYKADWLQICACAPGRVAG